MTRLPTDVPARARPASGVERSEFTLRALLLVLTNFCRSLGGGWPGA